MDNKFITGTAIILALGVLTTSSIISNATFADSLSNPISGPVDPTSTPDPISGPINPTPAPTAEPTNPPSNNNNNNNGNNGGGSNNGGGNSGPQPCNDAKPGLPILVSATKTGPNQVTLKWVRATSGPVTHYLLAYGVKSNQPIYGLPNATSGAGDQFTVRGLSAGQTYFFKVKAVNGCMPGDFSNELASGQVAGAKFTGPAKNFQKGVIAPAKPNTVKNTAPAPSVINLPKTNNNEGNEGLGNKIKSFFKNIFG